jgi:hypothetical protein
MREFGRHLRNAIKHDGFRAIAFSHVDILFDELALKIDHPKLVNVDPRKECSPPPNVGGLVMRIPYRCVFASIGQAERGEREYRDQNGSLRDRMTGRSLHNKWIAIPRGQTARRSGCLYARSA